MKQFNKILAILVAMFLLLSLTVLPVFADGDDDPVATGENDTETTGENDTETTGENETDAPEEAGASEGENTESENPEGETSEGDTSEGDTSEGDTPEVGDATGENDTAESKGLSTAAIVWIAVGGVILVTAVVLCVVFRERIGKFFRVYKSEIKKIVWLPWNQTCKSTLVVLVILIVCATVIFLVDLGLSTGFLEFLELFKKA